MHLRFRNVGHVLRAADSGGESSLGSSSDDDRSSDDRRPSAPEVLSRYSGDAVAMSVKITELLRDLYQSREKLREIRDRVIPQGGVGLTPEEAAEWQAYRELGKIDDLKTARDQLEEATSRLNAVAQKEAFQRAAAAEKNLRRYDPDVLSELPGLPTPTIVDGRAVVKVDEKDVPLDEHLDAKFARWLPALVQATGDRDEKSDREDPVRFPKQSRSDQGKKKMTAGQRYMAQRYTPKETKDG